MFDFDVYRGSTTVVKLHYVHWAFCCMAEWVELFFLFLPLCFWRTNSFGNWIAPIIFSSPLFAKVFKNYSQFVSSSSIAPHVLLKHSETPPCPGIVPQDSKKKQNGGDLIIFIKRGVVKKGGCLICLESLE